MPPIVVALSPLFKAIGVMVLKSVLKDFTRSGFKWAREKSSEFIRKHRFRSLSPSSKFLLCSGAVGVVGGLCLAVVGTGVMTSLGGLAVAATHGVVLGAGTKTLRLEREVQNLSTQRPARPSLSPAISVQKTQSSSLGKRHFLTQEQVRSISVNTGRKPSFENTLKQRA